MTDASVEDTRRPTQRLTPDRVRGTVFSRSPIGRRGLNEDEVALFQQRVAEEIAARDASEASLRAKVTHYKNTLVQWQREQSEARPDEPAVATPAAPRPTVEAVNILSQAQQEADGYVAQTQEHCWSPAGGCTGTCAGDPDGGARTGRCSSRGGCAGPRAAGRRGLDGRRRGPGTAAPVGPHLPLVARKRGDAATDRQ